MASWADVAWAVEVTFTASALAAGGSITLTTTGQGYKTVGTIDLGTAPGIIVGGPTDTDSAAVDIGAGETWVAKFDSRSGAMRGKCWQAGTPEPATWNVEVALAETEDDDDRFDLWVRAGTGQTVRVLDLASYDAARPGEEVVTELLGYANGTDVTFRTAHRFREGTLWPLVLGMVAPAITEDGQATTFLLDTPPTAGSGIHASYVVAGDDE